MRTATALVGALIWLIGGPSTVGGTHATFSRQGASVSPVAATASVPHDADDPAIWRHPSDPSQSLILATDKSARTGGLYVFGLDGRQRHAVTPLDRPNNVDVEYGVALGARTIDIAVVTERMQHRLRIFGLPADGSAPIDLAPEGLPVLAGQKGEAAEPMGIGLYKRPHDGAAFAVVAPKTGAATDYLWQYRLRGDAAGRPELVPVRRFGHFSRRGVGLGTGEIEAVVVDDELGYVYYADERYAIHKWHADPDHAEAARELAVFGDAGYRADREGLAIYSQPNGRGFIVSTDQISGGSVLHLYAREGAASDPHRHDSLGRVRLTADATDGIDVTSAALPGYPRGLLVAMNSRGRNFQLFSWETVEGEAIRR